MPDVIVICLHPDKPIDNRNTPFSTYLNGLSITAYDRSFSDPTGTNPPGTTPPNQINTASYPPPTPNSSINGIIQPDPTKQVAYAIIDISAKEPSATPPYPEYLTTDLRLSIQRASAGGQAETIIDQNMNYNVAVVPSASFDPTNLLPNYLETLTPALYLSVPPPAGTAVNIALPTDGNPPAFADLAAAINHVVSADPGTNNLTSVASLKPPVCRHIAYEILWNRTRDPLPVLASGDHLSDFYDSTVDNFTKRTKFESSLSAYYAKYDAESAVLAKYVFAVATATWCQQQTATASAAEFAFPVVTTVSNTALAKVATADVVVSQQDGSGRAVDLRDGPLWLMNPDFSVPAQYFYALTASLGIDVSPAVRYRMTTSLNPAQILATLQTAHDAGVIALDPSVTFAQAARRLTALGASTEGAVSLVVTPPSSPNITALGSLLQAWLADTRDDISAFWAGAPLFSGQPGYAAGYLQLVLYALMYEDPTTFINAAGLHTVDDFVQLLGSPSSIQSLFQAHPNSVPAFAKVGSAPWPPRRVTPPPPQPSNALAAEWTAAFARRANQFFHVQAGPSPQPTSAGAQAPQLAFPVKDPTKDPIAALVAAIATAYPNFTFSQSTLTDHQLRDAAQGIFPDDPGAQGWLVSAVRAINDLWPLTDVLGSVQPASNVLSVRFSLMEALYARGFTGPTAIDALTADCFQNALLGTPAYAYASAIAAKANQSTTLPQQNGGSFAPINDGTLVDCVPPASLSPLGAPQYLHELLRLSLSATCENLQGQSGKPVLGDTIATRRGPIGDLLASCANLETPLPKIDLVNECLEALVAGVNTSTVGAVFDTSSTTLAGLPLAPPDFRRHDGKPFPHDATQLFAAVPEHSSLGANASSTAYERLKADFSASVLPYSLPLDLCRSYQRAIGTTRFATMLRFRKDVTEFVLDPSASAPPQGFATHRRRYPIHLEAAAEYLGISPEERVLFASAANGTLADGSGLYGFSPAAPGWPQSVLKLSEFLPRTGLTYCELVDLQKGLRSNTPSLAFSYSNGSDQHAPGGGLPSCEPCCLAKGALVPELPNLVPLTQWLTQLAVFLRLWRKLQQIPGAKYTFAQLADIFALFFTAPAVDDPVRQLAALQMLRDELGLPLADVHEPPDPNAVGAGRTHILALFAGPTSPKWGWAVDCLLDGIMRHARRAHRGEERPAELAKILAKNLDPLARLAGLGPAGPTTGSAADLAAWNTSPTRVLRLSEVLSKICASEFTVGEILYLFTTEKALDGDDPFPLPTTEDSLDSPLDLPEDGGEHSLWALRGRLLEVEVSDEDACAWTWERVAASLRDDLGFRPGTGEPDRVVTLGERFFPEVLGRAGHTVDARERRYTCALGATATSPQLWNTAEGPFRYDAGAHQLWTELPLRDEAVLEKLARIRTTGPGEMVAVSTLYFGPRQDLAPFAFLFPSFQEADQRLIQEADEEERWRYFQREFARCHARCRMLARHLAHHVSSVTGRHDDACPDQAWQILRRLLADGNAISGAWEDGTGAPPSVLWPTPSAKAYVALLGLAGTGLMGEYALGPNAPLWWELRGPMRAFNEVHNAWSAPIPTLVPALDATLTSEQARFVGVRNGIAVGNASGRALGGVQGFQIHWHGVLLVEEAGPHEFSARVPGSERTRDDEDGAEHGRWRVTLRRGQKSWTVASHHWADGDGAGERSGPIALKRGAYELTVDFVRPTPGFREPREEQTTGFELRYCGPDTAGNIVPLPLHRLFVDSQPDGGPPINEGLANAPTAVLQALYATSLRDARRTYQRTFKALLLAHRFRLDARVLEEHGQSELGFLLDHPSQFEGVSFFKPPGTQQFMSHHASLDLDFLPVRDPYHPPTSDPRANPSVMRQQALFDQWERLFDYTSLRRQVHDKSGRALWPLFEEAASAASGEPASPLLLRHLGIDASFARLLFTYNAGPVLPSYTIAPGDLGDERWVRRVWEGSEWIRRVREQFDYDRLEQARPDLWAADDPGAATDPTRGNYDLTRGVQRSLVEKGEPRRYEDLKALNDGVRERARRALIAYLCSSDRVAFPSAPTYVVAPKQLSDLLLLDVEAGRCERVSRIDEAITSVQTLVLRTRLGLEPSVQLGPGFYRLWDQRYATFHLWQSCKRRILYRENWIEWDELEEARRSEGFRFFENGLRRGTLTVAEPGPLAGFAEARPPALGGLKLLQAREPATLRLNGPAGQAVQNTFPQAGSEGLTVAGRSDAGGQPSWLAALATSSTTSTTSKLPWWIEAAVRLGTHFLRVPAAGLPPAAMTRGASGDAECCCVCGRKHEPGVDEYYFWLVDSRHFVPPQTQDAGWNWDDDGAAASNTDLPALLSWSSSPTVHLMWCRVHDGQLQPTRRSAKGIQLDLTNAVLELDGRGCDGSSNNGFDSIYLKVTASSAGGIQSGSAPWGFRYDLATDLAVLIHSQPAGASPQFWGLPAYPYFAYFAPGAPLMPHSRMSEAVAAACTLRAHCRFDDALRWYETFFPPLARNTNWCPMKGTTEGVSAGGGRTSGGSGSEGGGSGGGGETGGGSGGGGTSTEGGGTGGGAGGRSTDGGASETALVAVREPIVQPPPPEQQPPQGVLAEPGPCCRDDSVSDHIARERAVTLDYVETLLDWGDATTRRHAPEAYEQARLIFDTAQKILGPRPRTVVEAAPTTSAPKVAHLIARNAPLNPRLVALYDRIVDRVGVIHTCANERRLRDERPRGDTAYWIEERTPTLAWRSELACAEGSPCGRCAEDDDCCALPSPYRFTFLTPKAIELANEVRSFGTALLTAIEKGDAEDLAFIRASHESQLAQLGLAIRQDAWRAADWDVQALERSKESAQNQLQYYTTLLSGGANTGERTYADLTTSAAGALTAATISETLATIFGIIPDLFVGEMDFAQIPIGTKLAGVFSGIGQISSTTAQIQSTNAGLDLTEAGWDRRNAEWRHQVDVYSIEIEQITRQIWAAQRRRNSALHDLNNAEHQIEQSRQVLDVLRDKFTSHDLYLWMQRESAALYREMYELAIRASRQAERAFNYERGYSDQRFVPNEAWDDLREGLLAGERLSMALRRMEKAYCDENVREYELTKHVSLRQLFPREFLRLKLTGLCEITLPEWLFDLDYPGHYMRRIRNVALTIPCVVGPYTGVHCRLTLLSSATRIVPWLVSPPHGCCNGGARETQNGGDPCGRSPAALHEDISGDHNGRVDGGYFPGPNDARIVRRHLAREAIATSTGQSDAGVFELNFRDERYLPFEYEGAVSRWRVELPPENNYFDLDTLSDVVLHLNYTAREGGDVLRRAASEAAEGHVPDAGWRVLDVRQELADEWRRFQADSPEGDRQLDLPIGRDKFLFLPGRRDLWVTRLQVFVEAPDADPGEHRHIRFAEGRNIDRGRAPRADDCREIRCVATHAWPGAFLGEIDVHLGPLTRGDGNRLGALQFDASWGKIHRLYLVLGYEARNPRGEAAAPRARFEGTPRSPGGSGRRNAQKTGAADGNDR